MRKELLSKIKSDRSWLKKRRKGNGKLRILADLALAESLKTNDDNSGGGTHALVKSTEIAAAFCEYIEQCGLNEIERSVAETEIMQIIINNGSPKDALASIGRHLN